MTDQDLKITDKRMFTPDGKLREEYRHLEESAGRREEPRESIEEPAARAPTAEAEAPKPEPPRSKAPGSGPTGPGAPGTVGPGPGAEPPRGAPRGPARKVEFEDLVGLLAEHAAIALGDAAMPDGQSMFDLRVAQMYIDLLDVLREKTAGNLAARQAELLEEMLYRLRLVYVEKSRETG